MTKRAYFGTDGIRGEANRHPMTAEVALRVGMAAGKVFMSQDERRHLVVIGKGYGVTNVIVTDALGRTLFDRDIVVSAPDSGQVSYIRGGETRGFSCSPRCQPIGGDTTAAPTP